MPKVTRRGENVNVEICKMSDLLPQSALLSLESGHISRRQVLRLIHNVHVRQSHSLTFQFRV